MVRFLRFAYAATSSIAIIFLLKVGTFSLHPWAVAYFPNPDYIAFCFALFPVVIGLVAQIWPSPGRSCPPLAAGAAGAVVGLAYGYVALVSIATSEFFHGYQDLWPLPIVGWGIDLTIFLFAIVAGTCALLLSMTARSRPIISTVGILILTAVLVPVPAFDLINHNQELTVAVAVSYNPDTTYEPEATADDNSTPVEDSRLSRRVLGRLREEGITGQYRVSELSQFGHGKQVLIVIVLNQPVVSEVVLQEPHGLDVFYLQQPDGWKMIPPHVPTLGRFITLKPPDLKDGLADMRMEFVGGTGMDTEIWKTPK